MNTHDGLDLPMITITVITTVLVPAETAGTIIEEVARAFERHARKQGRRDLRLGLKRVDIGSLIIDLIVIGRGPGRPKPNELAQKFVSATSRLLDVAQGRIAGSASRADGRLIAALSTLVSDGTAERVNMAIPGNVDGVLIDAGVVRLIEQQRSLLVVPGSSRATLVPEREVPDQLGAPSLFELRGKAGTVFDVKGVWYVRLDSEDGVLIPLELGSGVAVQDDGVYSFDGSWIGKRYYIQAARRIG